MSTFVDMHRFDFNLGTTSGNGSFGDLLWRDHAGEDVLWIMNNDSPDFTHGGIAVLPTVTPDWHFKAAADFDAGGPGNADILWQNDNGSLALWQMNGTTVRAISALPNPGPTWHVVGDNDFNGDAADDIFFQNDNGSLALWTITSASPLTISGIFAGTQNPGPTWHVVGTGDTNNNGTADVLWQNNDGTLVLWRNPTFGAATFTFNSVVALPAVDASWHVKGMQDINGNGTADIVFQNDNGAVVVWEMGAAGILKMNLVDINPGPSWHVVGLRDMDHDTRIDILFQNDNGSAAIWEDYQSLGGGSATFNTVLPITPDPNPNGHVWDLL